MASPQYELGRDADGNVILVPAQSQVRAPIGFWEDVVNKSKQYFAPRPSDFTKGTKEAFGAGQELSELGYENFSTNPLYGAGQVVAGSALSALSPISGATDFLLNPAGRTFGPPAEHAADVASMVLPTPSKGGAMLKFKPNSRAAIEAAEAAGSQPGFKTKVRPKEYGPPEMQGPQQITPQTLIGPPEMQGPPNLFRYPEPIGPEVPFRTNVQPKIYGPPEMQGPMMPFQTNVRPKIYGPPEMQGPRQITPQTMIGPPEMQGPMRSSAANLNDPNAALIQSIIDKSANQIAASRAAEQTKSATQQLIEAAARRANTGSEAMYPNYRPYSPPNPYLPLAVGAAGAGAAALSGGADVGRQKMQSSIDMQAVDDADRNQNYRSQSLTNMQAIDDADRANNWQLQFDDSMPNRFTPEQQQFLQQQAAINAARNMPDFQQTAPNTAGAGRGFMHENLNERAKYEAAQEMAQRQAQRPAQTQGQNQPAAQQPSSGFFSNLFTNRPASTKQLFEQSQANPDDAGAWMRAERQYAATHKDNPNFDVTQLNDQGMARGGSAGGAGGKDAALHKALEIIHHMLMQR